MLTENLLELYANYLSCEMELVLEHGEQYPLAPAFFKWRGTLLILLSIQLTETPCVILRVVPDENS